LFQLLSLLFCLFTVVTLNLYRLYPSCYTNYTHLIQLEAFFSTLSANGLAIKLAKCIIAVPTLEIHSHTISAAGSTPTAVHIAAIDSCPHPQDINQLQRFLGMVYFYHHFLPGCDHFLRPIIDLLRGSPKTLEGIAAAEEALLFKMQSAYSPKLCHLAPFPSGRAFFSQ
jgi:hypothetical protein